jgi:hypothetical protein
VGRSWGGSGDLAPLWDADEQIAERQFTLSFLNTAVDALALVAFGVALATRVLPGEHSLLLTLLPAAVAGGGIVLGLLVAGRAGAHAGRLQAAHHATGPSSS